MDGSYTAQPGGLVDMMGCMADEFRVQSAREFAARLQQALREEGSAGSDRWRAAIDDGLSAAYAAGDIVALCEVVQAIGSLLDAQGKLREAVAEISHAIALAGDEANALAILNSMKATLLAACGDFQGSGQAIVDAERTIQGANVPFAKSKCAVNCAAARLLVLSPDPVDTSGLRFDAPDGARTADALFLMSYLIPFQFASGARADAHPMLRTFRLQAAAARHDYRLADARVSEAAEEAISTPLKALDFGEIPRWNWLANWRAEVLRFRQLVLRRSWAEAEASLTMLLRARRRAGDAQLDSIDGFEMLLMALTERADPVRADVPLPESVHLLNLPSVLAAAEAVALDGTQHAAAVWHRWFASKLPPWIATSMEWPVSRWRIQALLALRSGNERAAKHDFEHAVGWATDAGYPIELAAAQLQLSELLRQRLSGAEHIWRALREKGADGLRLAGLDAAVFAYAVARTVPSAGKYSLRSPLTSRETETLGYLAEGLSYRAMGDQMGIKWTTVQTLAHRCYEKLEASGRQAAVARARELGLL